MNRIHNTRNSIARWTLLALVAVVLTPITALAMPVVYEFYAGTAAVSGTIDDGSGNSIFLPDPIVDVDLIGTSATVDLSTNTLNNLTIIADDFKVDLNPGLTGLESVSVTGATLQSLAPGAIFVITTTPNTFGQFAVQTEITGTAQATALGGTPLPATPFVSNPGSGATSGFITVTGDEVTLQMTGVTVATFPQIHNPTGPNIELKADFTFVGKAATPIPEPSAAIVFGLGITLAGTAVRKRD